MLQLFYHAFCWFTCSNRMSPVSYLRYKFIRCSLSVYARGTHCMPCTSSRLSYFVNCVHIWRICCVSNPYDVLSRKFISYIADLAIRGKRSWRERNCFDFLFLKGIGGIRISKQLMQNIGLKLYVPRCLCVSDGDVCVGICVSQSCKCSLCLVCGLLDDSVENGLLPLS